MSSLNWAMVSDGGIFESLMHAILFAEDAGTLLFGRPGKDAGQDARSSDGNVVYQAKYRKGLTMDGTIVLAKEELSNIKKYSDSKHSNYKHWKDAQRWVLVANFSINPNDHLKWTKLVLPEFQKNGIIAEYWDIESARGVTQQI